MEIKSIRDLIRFSVYLLLIILCLHILLLHRVNKPYLVYVLLFDIHRIDTYRTPDSLKK